jgi:hypothetical protein
MIERAARVGFAAWVIGMTASTGAFAQTPPAAPADAPSASPPGQGGEKPPPAEDEEGPFAPKGRTGKLREQQQAETPKDEGGEAPGEEEKPGHVGIDAVIGFGKLAEAGAPASSAPDVTAYSFVIGAGYELSPSFGLSLRFPFTSASIKEAGGDKSESAAAIGNVELAPEYVYRASPTTKIPIELAIVAPTATGDPFAAVTEPEQLRRAAAQDIAAAARGWEDNALFAPHRFGVVPRVGLEYARGAMEIGAFTKYELTFKSGGNDAPPGYKANTGMTWVTGGSFFYEVLPETLSVGTRAWLTELVTEEIEAPLGPGEASPSKTQFVLEPGVRAKIKMIRPSIGYILPIGGRLGGDAKMSGLRIAVAAVF